MTDFAEIRYADAYHGDAPLLSRIICPCGTSNPAMLWPCDRHGASARSAGHIQCQTCHRIITADGVIVGRGVFDQEQEVGA